MDGNYLHPSTDENLHVDTAVAAQDGPQPQRSSMPLPSSTCCLCLWASVPWNRTNHVRRLHEQASDRLLWWQYLIHLTVTVSSRPTYFNTVRALLPLGLPARGFSVLRFFSRVYYTPLFRRGEIFHAIFHPIGAGVIGLWYSQSCKFYEIWIGVKRIHCLILSKFSRPRHL